MLVLRKLALTFVVAFSGVFLAGLLPILDTLGDNAEGTINMSTTLDALVALFVSAVIVALRAIVMYLTAFVPGDAQHGVSLIGAYKPASKN